jgi:hypothetical protein
MDPRALAGLTAAVLLLMQLHMHLLPGARAVRDPFSAAAQRQVERSAELRRRGIDSTATHAAPLARPATAGAPQLLETLLLAAVAHP